MENDLLDFTKNVVIDENKEVTIKIEIKEIMEENDKLNIILQIAGEDFKKIEIRRK
jgi:hypothetical protein